MSSKNINKSSKTSSKSAKKASNNSPEVNVIVNKIGHKIAGLRQAQGLSLQQLAAKSDVSPASIHKIERSNMVPTITTILKLGVALGVPVSYFVQEDESDPEPIHLTNAKDRSAVFTPHKGLTLEGISGSYRQFGAAAAVAHMDPNATSGRKLLKHPGEELVYIMSGEVFFRVGEHDFLLKAGDSLHFSGEVPHHWENASGKKSKLIWIALRKNEEG